MNQNTEQDTIPPGPLQKCRSAGFQHAAFISWPHQIQSRGGEIISALQKALEDRFKDEGGASVFLDQTRFKPSYRWDDKLRQGLCRSPVTIAFLLRTYFESEYCRLEWAISESLERLRVSEEIGESLIIPIALSKTFPLPAEVKSIQYEKAFLEILSSGRDLSKHEGWPLLIDALAERIMELIELVCQSERDWDKEEALARTTQSKRFTWPPPALPSEGPSIRSTFPRLVVEKSGF